MAPAVLATPGRILYLDAYDSFSNNIVSQIEQSVDADVVSIRIDDPRFTTKSAKGTIISDSARFVRYLKSFDAVIAGPGPGWASVDADVGLMQELWKLQDEDLLPVLGICLGFQSLALEFGADVERLTEPRHGLISEILHSGLSIFQDVDQLLATQYHSLQVNIGHPIQTTRAVRYPKELWIPTQKCPELEPLAWDFEEKRNGAVLMGLRHINKPFWGVQFHPESICTNGEGTRIIQNWCLEAHVWNHAKKRTTQRLENGDQSFQSNESYTSQLLSYSLRAKGTPRLHALKFAFEMAQDGLPPALVHCATTGSGRLTVQDVCESFNIAKSEAIVLQSGLQSDLLPLKVGTGRYSIIGLIIPNETLRLHYYTGSKILQLRKGKDEIVLESEVEDVWSYVRTIMQYLKPGLEPSGPSFAPFWGGLMGYVSHEAGLETIGVQPLPTEEGKPVIPDICFAYITRSIVFDHQVKKIYIQSIRSLDDRAWVLEAYDTIYEAAGQKSAASTPSANYRANPFEALQVPAVSDFIGSCERSVVPLEPYCERIAQCQDFIRDGHSYELCLTAQNAITGSRPASCNTPTSSNELSWSLYKRLTSRNPAPFSAYIRLHNLHILSSSPERYISWSRSGVAQCRPIKGTVSKMKGATAADAITTLSSSKERAENLMIVDLTRHQLHGVYGSGNVQVTKLMEIEEYETLWQLVSVIEAVPPGIPKARTPEEWEEPADYVSMKKGSKREEKNLGFEAFVQSLPPGSMTGAPKKRSCEILKQLEGKRRGIYSGVLGYLDVGGAGDFSVVIRTAVKVDGNADEDGDGAADARKETWTVGAGGAITSQSVLQSEYEEMREKFWSTGRAFMA